MMTNKPVILNLNKPKDISSYDVIRKWKPRLKKLGKVGHFGTLDPFASGVLMLGVAGAQRLNEYIHECLPKTYLAIGKLGLETPTGDLTVDPSQVDESEYLEQVIAKFDTEFIQKTISEKFLGEYWQAPHKYSAAKFEGKALHKWAREGVEIKKEEKRREIYEIEVVEYLFPDLLIRFKVSSGTYIRTLFADCANELGTIGVLDSLIREEVGGCKLENSLGEETWSSEEIPFIDVDEVLQFSSIIFGPKECHLYKNGVRLNEDRAMEIKKGNLNFNYFWVRDEENTILGLAEIVEGEIVSRVNFAT
jgi:tRNA pseudouridine55 synthase